MATVTSLNRPPPHLQGNLVFHSTSKLGIPRLKRGFFVLLETVIHRYDSESSYFKRQRSTKEFEIHLDEVCEITEVLVPSKQYKNCSFGVTLSDSDTEYVFSAESREEMERWVHGLRRAKEFWAQHYRREEVKQKQKFRQNLPHLNQTFLGQNEAPKLEHNIFSTSDGEHIAQVIVTTWDGIMHKLLLPVVFDAEELLSALSGKVHVQRKGFAACPTCRLQQSSMEIWTVTESGIGKKLDHKRDALDVSRHGRHFYLLVHNYKLLIVHFEDGTFQVLPCLVSLKAKEVPYLPVFADKLSSLGLSNFGLFLVSDSGTAFPFDQEEQPLKHSFQGRFLLKEKVLTASSPVSLSRLDIQIQQRRKVLQNLKNMKALKKLDRQQCKQNSAFPLKVTKDTALNLSGDLVFHFDHYDVTDDENGSQVNTTKHTTQNGDSHICGAVDFDSVGQEQSSSQGEACFQKHAINVTNGYECFVEELVTNNGLLVKDESINCSPVVSTERCKESMEQVNGETTDIGNSSDLSQKLSASCLPQMLSDPAFTESLELPKSPPKMEFPHGKMNESMKKEHSYPSVRESLCKDDCTLPMRIGGEPPLTDGGCVESIVTVEGLTIKGKETNVQTHDLANGESVNHQNSKPTNEESASFERHTSVIKEDTIAVTNDTNGGESIKNHCFERIGEGTASQYTIEGETLAECYLPDDKTVTANTSSDQDVSVESYFSAEGDEISSQNVGNNSLKGAACDDSNPALAHKTSSHKAINVNLGKPTGSIDVQNVCKERPHLEIHQCDYTIVGSPCVLELVLKVCSGWKMDEEEVGEGNTFTKICLSGWHFQCENGTWSMVERGRVPSFINESTSSTVNVQLTKNLKALFHKEEKLWTVVENDHVVDGTLASTSPVEDQTLNSELEIPKEARPENLRSGSNSNLDVFLFNGDLQGDATFHSESENVNQDQSLPVTSNIPDESSRGQKGRHSEVNYDATHVFESRERKNKPETHPTLGLSKSNSKHSPEDALRVAIQGIFDQMSKFSGTPEEALDDSKHKDIVEGACEPLCKALWNILSVGLRKKNFLRKYTLWNVVENFKDVSSHVTKIVSWVNKRYVFLSEPQKFQAFVCECLSIGHGTLHRWLDSFLRQKERLGKYYGETALVFQLPPATLDELVVDLSRVSSLPFQLHSESWIKRHHYDQDSLAFAFE